jgi:FdhE protein
MLKDSSWEEIAAVFEKARTRQPALSELLDFYERLVREQHAVIVDVEPNSYDEALLRGLNGRGEALLRREQFRIDLALAATLFRDLCRLAEERGGTVREAAEEIEAAVASGALDLQDLLRGTAAEEGFPFAVADQLSLDPELLNTLADASIHPGVQAFAKPLGSFVDNDRWLKGICPVCGSEPKFAELRGEELAASKYLHCGFCGWAWPARRLGCPFCDNKDHNRLQTLIIENHLQCKLEVCDVCRRYLKVVDNKEFIGLIPEIEALATPHLDLAAMERGYH